MSARGTPDAVGALTAAPGSYSVQDLLAAGPAANAICTTAIEAMSAMRIFIRLRLRQARPGGFRGALAK